MMSVYVDTPLYNFGRMVMCHMIADTKAELLAMAARMGVAGKWIQYPDTAREHFDICKSKRQLAVSYGAVEVSPRTLAAMLRERRRG